MGEAAAPAPARHPREKREAAERSGPLVYIYRRAEGAEAGARPCGAAEAATRLLVPRGASGCCLSKRAWSGSAISDQERAQQPYIHTRARTHAQARSPLTSTTRFVQIWKIIHEWWACRFGYNCSVVISDSRGNVTVLHCAFTVFDFIPPSYLAVWKAVSVWFYEGCVCGAALDSFSGGKTHPSLQEMVSVAAGHHEEGC